MLLIFQIQFLFPMYFIEYFLQCHSSHYIDLLSIIQNKLVIHINDGSHNFRLFVSTQFKNSNSLRENFVILMHILAAHKSIDGTTIVYEMLFYVVAKRYFYIFLIFSAAANL